MEVWEFLSAWSDLYGLDCDQSLLGTINATFKEANVNMRRAMGDIVEDLDAKRKKANASLSKLASTNLPQAALGVRHLGEDGHSLDLKSDSVNKLPFLNAASALPAKCSKDPQEYLEGAK